MLSRARRGACEIVAGAALWRCRCEIVAGAALWRCRCRSRGRRSILCIWVCVCAEVVAGAAFCASGCSSCWGSRSLGSSGARGTRVAPGNAISSRRLQGVPPELSPGPLVLCSSELVHLVVTFGIRVDCRPFHSLAFPF